MHRRPTRGVRAGFRSSVPAFTGSPALSAAWAVMSVGATHQRVDGRWATSSEPVRVNVRVLPSGSSFGTVRNRRRQGVRGAITLVAGAMGEGLRGVAPRWRTDRWPRPRLRAFPLRLRSRAAPAGTRHQRAVDVRLVDRNWRRWLTCLPHRAMHRRYRMSEVRHGSRSTWVCSPRVRVHLRTGRAPARRPSDCAHDG